MTLCSFCRGPEHSGNCDREALKARIQELVEENRILHLHEAARQKIPGEGVIMIRSLISHRDQKPRIDIQVGEIHTQMDADAAMDVAKNLIECSRGAYADAFIFHFLTEKLDQPRGVAGQTIEEFRDYREQLAREFEKDQKGKTTG